MNGTANNIQAEYALVTCTKCGKRKDLSEFYKKTPGRSRSRCKSCVKEDQRNAYKKSVETVNPIAQDLAIDSSKHHIAAGPIDSSEQLSKTEIEEIASVFGLLAAWKGPELKRTFSNSKVLDIREEIHLNGGENRHGNK